MTRAWFTSVSAGAESSVIAVVCTRTLARWNGTTRNVAARYRSGAGLLGSSFMRTAFPYRLGDHHLAGTIAREHAGQADPVRVKPLEESRAVQSCLCKHLDLCEGLQPDRCRMHLDRRRKARLDSARVRKHRARYRHRRSRPCRSAACLDRSGCNEPESPARPRHQLKSQADAQDSEERC